MSILGPKPSRHGPDFHRPQSQITIDSPDFHLRGSQNCLLGSAIKLDLMDLSYVHLKHDYNSLDLIAACKLNLPHGQKLRSIVSATFDKSNWQHSFINTVWDTTPPVPTISPSWPPQPIKKTQASYIVCQSSLQDSPSLHERDTIRLTIRGPPQFLDHLGSKGPLALP